MWGKEVRSWSVRNQVTCLSYSGRGMLSVAGKSGATIYRDLHTPSKSIPTPYLTLPLHSLTASSSKFCPFEDTLAIGHSSGISSLLVPGSGEANFDSAEADVYETYSRRREREVRGVLEKIRPELITLDTDFLGKVSLSRGGETFEERESRDFRQLGRLERLKVSGKAQDDDGQVGNGDDDDNDDNDDGGEISIKEKEKRKMRGKGKSMKRYLKKKKKNVIDPALVCVSFFSIYGLGFSFTCGNRT